MSTFMLGAKALKRLVTDQNPFAFINSRLTADLFKGDELLMYEFITKHHGNYQVLPQLSTLESEFPDLKSLDVPEPSKYYLTLVEKRYSHGVLDRAAQDSQAVLKANQDHTDAAANVLSTALSKLTAVKYRHKIMDFAKEAPALIMNAYHNMQSDGAVAGFGWPYMDQQMGGMLGGDLISIVGRPATGKAQPLHSKVLLGDGRWTTMAELVVGDTLASTDGAHSQVEAIFPQGEQTFFKLTFSDGRSADATGDHLWEVHYRTWTEPKVLNTNQIIGLLQKKRYQNRLSIRLFSGEFGGRELPLDPYLLGFLLGDGCFRANSPGFSSADKELVDRVAGLVSAIGCKVMFRSAYDYSIVKEPGSNHGPNPVKDGLVELGLWGLKSEDKSIPFTYLQGSRAQRIQLLQGLMDTDGSADKTGGMSFSSSSPKLITQVRDLVRSLGGSARIALKKTTHLDHYRINVVIHNRSEAFSLTRKVARVHGPKTTHVNNRLTITSAEPSGVAHCQCIRVSHPNHLYITDDFVVTHNTYHSLHVANYNWSGAPKLNTLFVSMEMNTLAIAQRQAAIYSHTPVGQLKVGGFSSLTLKKFVGSMQGLQLEEAKLYIVDGNLAASVEDIYNLASALNCKLVWIDGAYLLKHRNPKMDRYTRVAENTEMMKRYTGDLNIPTGASWQFNREASKKAGKKGEEAGLEDIGYTDAIGQISSVVLGLLQPEGVETMEKREVRVMKGRNGEVGKFEVKWDFSNMDFRQWGTEADVATASTMNFI